MPQLRRGADGQIEVVPPKQQNVPAPGSGTMPQLRRGADGQIEVVPPKQQNVPAPAPAVAPAATPAAPEIRLPEPLAIELPAGVTTLSPSEPPLRDLLRRASGGGRRITSDLSKAVGVGPVEITWTAWDDSAGGNKVAATRTAMLFVLPTGMTPAGQSGSENATGGNNAAKIARDAAGRVHMVWKSDAKDVTPHVIYRRATTDADGGVIWETEPVKVEDTTAVRYDSFPALAVSGETVHIAWQAGGTVHYRRIVHGSYGWEWGPERDIGAASTGRDVGPGIDASGATVHIVTPSGNYAISTDRGDTWKIEPIPLPPDVTTKTVTVAGDRTGNAHVAFSGVVHKVPPNAGGYWELRYVRRTADGAWVDARNALAGSSEWAAGPGDHLADWVRIVADDDDNIHLTWHGTAISRRFANDQSYYALRRAAGPGQWADAWQPPILLQPSDPGQGIGFSYAPSLAVGSGVAVPVTFYDVGGQGFDAVARIVRRGALEGPPIVVADWIRKSIDTKTPESALSARFPSAAQRLFRAPDGRVWLDLLETLIPSNIKGAPKLIVYHPIDVTDAIQGNATANGSVSRPRPAADVIARRSYGHIFVIVEENHGYRQIIGSPAAPNINRLAKEYGLATNFYAEVHPSEANYVAMIGGDTFGIHDDDAQYCKPGSTDPNCPRAKHDNYADHTITTRSLIDQLNEHGLSWKGYFENIPAPGSKAVYSSGSPALAQPDQLYAAKHNGFINFAIVQNDPRLASKFVGFDQLAADVASGDLPNYAHVVPNQCNEMHGLSKQAPNVPADCAYDNDPGLITRGDKVIGDIVRQIQASPAWSAKENFAIVITWDEDSGSHPSRKTEIVDGCCGFDPESVANNGGGHIATLVITNHGPRGVSDDTPYNHYSLLRTTEDAFGIAEHLNIAGDTQRGVRSMKLLFGLP